MVVWGKFVLLVGFVKAGVNDLFKKPACAKPGRCSAFLKMKTTIITILLVVLSLVSFGQSKQLTDKDYNNSGAIKLIFVTTIGEAQKLAQTDIDKGIPFLLLQSGIAPVIYTTDSLFENKFKVYYYEKGCTGPDYEMMKAYNQTVFEFMDIEYGKKWRKSVRKDVIGLKKWKRKN